MVYLLLPLISEKEKLQSSHFEQLHRGEERRIMAMLGFRFRDAISRNCKFLIFFAFLDEKDPKAPGFDVCWF